MQTLALHWVWENLEVGLDANLDTTGGILLLFWKKIKNREFIRLKKKIATLLQSCNSARTWTKKITWKAMFLLGGVFCWIQVSTCIGFYATVLQEQIFKYNYHAILAVFYKILSNFSWKNWLISCQGGRINGKKGRNGFVKKKRENCIALFQNRNTILLPTSLLA